MRKRQGAVLRVKQSQLATQESGYDCEEREGSSGDRKHNWALSCYLGNTWIFCFIKCCNKVEQSTWASSKLFFADSVIMTGSFKALRNQWEASALENLSSVSLKLDLLHQLSIPISPSERPCLRGSLLPEATMTHTYSWHSRNKEVFNIYLDVHLGQDGKS